MPSWPDTFPCSFIASSLSVQPISNATAIDTESGEPMSRRRFTGEMEQISGTLSTFSRDEIESFKNFFRYDLADGSLRFTWQHPISFEAVDMIFLAAPSFRQVGPGKWQAQVRLQTLP